MELISATVDEITAHEALQGLARGGGTAEYLSADAVLGGARPAGKPWLVGIVRESARGSSAGVRLNVTDSSFHTLLVVPGKGEMLRRQGAWQELRRVVHRGGRVLIAAAQEPGASLDSPDPLEEYGLAMKQAGLLQFSDLTSTVEGVRHFEARLRHTCSYGSAVVACSGGNSSSSSSNVAEGCDTDRRRCTLTVLSVDGSLDEDARGAPLPPPLPAAGLGVPSGSAPGTRGSFRRNRRVDFSSYEATEDACASTGSGGVHMPEALEPPQARHGRINRRGGDEVARGSGEAGGGGGGAGVEKANPLDDQDLTADGAAPAEAPGRATPNFFAWREVFPELKVLSEGFDQILAEARGVGAWKPWPEEHYNEGGSRDWKVFPFMHTFPAHDPSRRTWVETTCARCPATVSLLRKVPNIRTALFSRLGPDTRISGHRGWADLANHVLRCHLPLVVPEGHKCGLWVDGEVQHHTTGEFLVFDDSKLHKAFNDSEEERLILIVDLLRPPGMPLGTAEGQHTPELDSFIAAFA